jgi:hypothetical protein
VQRAGRALRSGASTRGRRICQLSRLPRASDRGDSAVVDDERRHELVIAFEQRKDVGYFTAGPRTGSFELTGSELSSATCSVCVQFHTPDGFYQAVSGTVHVAELTSPATADGGTTGRLTTTLENVRFELAKGLDATSCSSSLASFTLDTPLRPETW